MTARMLPLLLVSTCMCVFATQADELVLQANLAKARGDVAGAESLLRSALGLEPQNGDANFAMGFLLQESGRYADAISYYNRALAAGMAEASLYYNRALCRQKTGDIVNARADNLLAQKLKPDDADVLIQAAMVEGDAGDEARACDYLHSAFKSLGITPTHLRQIAILAENCDDGSLALQAADWYLRQRPNDPAVQRLRARVLARPGSYAESIAAWQELADATGEKDDWLGGLKAARDGNDDNSELLFSSEIYKRYGDSTYLCELGNKRLIAGEYAGAEVAFSKLKPEDSQAALWNLAVAQEKQRKLDIARETWRLYLSISTDSVARAKVEKHMAGLGSEAKQPSKPDTTTPAESSNDMQGMLCAQEANKLCNAGKYSEALPKWQEAINLLPAMPDLVYNMAGTLEKLDRLEDAKIVWQHYLTLDITSRRKAEIERHLEDLNRELERKAQEKIDAANGEPTPHE